MSGWLQASDELASPRHKVVLRCLAIVSAATAVIHFAVAGSHFQDYWLYGVFMLLVAWLQALWAVGAIARPTRWLLWAGIVLNAGIVGVYLVTRTVGDVVGPGAHGAEALGFGDALCTVLELAVVVFSAALLISKAGSPVSRAQLVAAPAATGGLIAVLLSFALVAGGPEMVMTGAAQPAHQHARLAAQQARHRPAMHMNMHKPTVAAARVSLPTRSPAGNIVMPAPMMQMATGMKMVESAPCTAAPTAAQRSATVALVNSTWKDTSRFQSLAAAKAAGFRPITPVGLPVVHYLNVGYYLNMLHTGAILNPYEPQSLVYANTPHGAVLVAAMFITTPSGPTPQPGGCLTQWHVHTNLCQTGGIGVVAVVSPAHPICPPGSANHVTPPMLHVWFVPIPGGPTAIDATDAQVVRAAERVPAHGNGTA